MKIPQGRQASLYAFCVLHHHTQKRKYTGEPYINHCIAVAEMADGLCDFGWEIGMCHDLIEDTECGGIELQKALKRFGYSSEDSDFILVCVMELTDMYTPENYPKLNRKERKSLEAKRLHKIRYESQTVKYCDLIDNTKSIVDNDKGFAIKYIAEKREILSGMKDGNKHMLRKCQFLLRKAEKELAMLV